MTTDPALIPCGCCKHEECGPKYTACLNCKYTATDNFEPVGKCGTCRYDPRKHGICRNCVDYDKHQATKERT